MNAIKAPNQGIESDRQDLGGDFIGVASMHVSNIQVRLHRACHPLMQALEFFKMLNTH